MKLLVRAALAEAERQEREAAAAAAAAAERQRLAAAAAAAAEAERQRLAAAAAERQRLAAEAAAAAEAERERVEAERVAALPKVRSVHLFGAFFDACWATFAGQNDGVSQSLMAFSMGFRWIFVGGTLLGRALAANPRALRSL